MNNHDPLSRVLKSWKHEPTPSPEFTKAVWARIDAPEQAPGSSFFTQLLHFPGRLPIAASFAVILAGLVGTGAALTINHEQATDRMATAYVRSIDPLQMTAAPTDAHSHS